MTKLKVPTVNVNNDFEFILMSAMRYAIGRRTYACHLVAEYIKGVWDKLSDLTKSKLQQDLQKAICDADKDLEYQRNRKISHGCGSDDDDKNCSYQKNLIEYECKIDDPLGHGSNRQTWTTLNSWMKERI